MEHYSAIRKDETLLFATTWINLENIMLREISQKEVRTIWYHSYEGYTTETQGHRQECGGCQSKGGKEGEGGRTHGDRRCFDSR